MARRHSLRTVGAAVVALGAGWAGGAGGGQPEKDKAEGAAKQPADEQAKAMAEMNRPSAEHKVMTEMCGVYDVTMTVYPKPGGEAIVMKGTATREMVLGGKHMQERVEVKDGPYPHSSMALMSYNADAPGGGRFEVVRLSSMVNCQMPETGTYDAATRTFSLKGEHAVNGMYGRDRVTIRLIGEGREEAEVFLSMEGYSDAFKGVAVPEYKAVVFEYVKRK